MDTLKQVLDFVINQLLEQTALFMDLIALIGLVLQRKPFREVLEGLTKTVVGMVIFVAGVILLVNGILPIQLGTVNS